MDINKLLSSVESRYNRTKTLQVQFSEAYRSSGVAGPTRTFRNETGQLYLRKPGRMRWEYTQPAGKLFLSDGKNVYLYLPSSNRAEKLKLKESEDMRAPLAFLLGKLDFKRDFISFDVKDTPAGTLVKAYPASQRLPYKQVEFTVGPDSAIRRLVVTGQDSSLLDFTFTNEQVNPKLDDKLFQFTLPAGAQLVDAGQ